jgi:hypothetical protein
MDLGVEIHSEPIPLLTNDRSEQTDEQLRDGTIGDSQQGEIKFRDIVPTACQRPPYPRFVVAQKPLIEPQRRSGIPEWLQPDEVFAAMRINKKHPFTRIVATVAIFKYAQRLRRK